MLAIFLDLLLLIFFHSLSLCRIQLLDLLDGHPDFAYIVHFFLEDVLTFVLAELLSCSACP